jgi:hypothetical protein
MRILLTLITVISLLQLSNAQFRYINPKPGSQYRNPETNIILKNGNYIDRTSIQTMNLVDISGSISGRHEYSIGLSDDNKTVIIKPTTVFACNETVTVNVHPGMKQETGEAIEGTSFSFKIRPERSPEMLAYIRQVALESFIEDYGHDPTEKNNHKPFPLDSMPTFVINVNSGAALGRIFYCNHEDQTDPGQGVNSFATIIENDGTVYWAKDLGDDGHDFKINANGYLTYYSYDTTEWMVMDSNYNVIDSLQAKNGYELETESHDMMVYPDGHVFLLVHDVQMIDMTPYGGVPNALVQGLVIQEQDANRDVVFEWSSWDHFLFTDANGWTPLTNMQVDYVHCNSVERDFDGNILISSRNMDELTKIDHGTGNIIWRMGGENNQFTFVNDNIPEHFSGQHDLRRLPNGNITIYNNGNHLNPLVSSAKEYALDEVNKVATLVWYYEHPDVNGLKVFGGATGNAQRLSNGNTLIDWGLVAYNSGIPNHTEVDHNKNIVWEMTFDSSKQKSYRIHKYAWNPCSKITGYTMKAVPKINATTLSWGKATGAKSYHLQYRKLGTNGWSSKSTKTPKIKIYGLTQQTTYEWRVETLCPNQKKSAYSPIATFTTPPLKLLEETAVATDLISVYPVPSSDVITIDINIADDEWNNASISVVNVVGNTVYAEKVNPESSSSIKIDIRNWPAGIYFVQFQNGNDFSVKKIIRN